MPGLRVSARTVVIGLAALGFAAPAQQISPASALAHQISPAPPTPPTGGVTQGSAYLALAPELSTTRGGGNTMFVFALPER
jgi:hypothetical protein